MSVFGKYLKQFEPFLEGFREEGGLNNTTNKMCAKSLPQVQKSMRTLSARNGTIQHKNKTASSNKIVVPLPMFLIANLLQQSHYSQNSHYSTFRIQQNKFLENSNFLFFFSKSILWL